MQRYEKIFKRKKIEKNYFCFSKKPKMEILKDEVILYAHHPYFGEVDFVENLKMGIVGNNVFRIAADGAIDKFVVVGIGFYKIEKVCWRDSVSVETHHSTLPSRKSLHIWWYGLLGGTHISRQFVSRTILLIAHTYRGFAYVHLPIPQFSAR